MTGTERILELPTLHLASLEWGRDGGFPALALHGWLDNAASFARLGPLLEGIHVVACDLPGHGRSDHRPAGCPHHFVDWVPAAVGAADALGWDRFSLVGHSMGAGISVLVAAVLGERVERLVLLEGAGPLSMPAEEAPRVLAKALASEAELADARNRLFTDLETAVRARAGSTDLDPESARLLVERAVDITSEGVRFTHDPRLKTRSRVRFTEDQVQAFLAAIRCPALVVRASTGWPYPEGVVERRIATLADVRVAEVEGGHHVHLTNPERVAPLIREFFGL
jgi:pimeloyl-ACP methyl ester carboxylesterase